MCDEIGISPSEGFDMDFGFVAASAASAVAQLWNGYRQRQQTDELEERRELRQMKAIRRQHSDALERLELQNEFARVENSRSHEEGWRRQKDQQQHNEQMQRDSWQLGRLADSYPIRRGPFHLRRHLQLCYPNDFPYHVPPVVLIQPLIDESNRGMWANARLHAQQLLGALYDDQLIHIPQGLPDRPFTWPDADLYQYDLLDIPTIIVSATAAPSGVNIWLGGSHLLPSEQECWPFAPARPVLSITTASLQQYIKSRPDAGAANKGLPVAIIRSDNSLDQEGIRWLMLEYVSRGIELCVTRMVDTFHLLRRRCYNERFDNAIGNLLTPSEAVRLAESRLDPPLDSVADPAYHLLHRARRSFRANNLSGGTKHLVDAFSLLAASIPDCSEEIKSRSDLESFLTMLVDRGDTFVASLAEESAQHLRLAAVVVENAPANSPVRGNVASLLRTLSTRVATFVAIEDRMLSVPTVRTGA